MHYCNAFRDFLVGYCVEVAILGMSSNLDGRRDNMLEDFMVL